MKFRLLRHAGFTHKRRRSVTAAFGRRPGPYVPSRLSSEPLEDRHMLSVVTVNNDLDLVNGDTSSIANLIASDGGLTTAVPEPGALGLLLIRMLGVAIRRTRC